jgi:uncharacterized protein YdcH (DUF465 family)
MHLRLFRLIERHQRIDEQLRFAQQRADSHEVARLRSLKLKVKQLIHRFNTRRALLGAQASLGGPKDVPA